MLDGRSRLGAFVRVHRAAGRARHRGDRGAVLHPVAGTSSSTPSSWSRSRARPLTVGIPGLVTPHGTLWGQVAAVAVVATVPIIIFTALVQRHLVRGLTFGAVEDERGHGDRVSATYARSSQTGP